ncbi:MAG: hypothetical protein NTY01_06890 [Verrucomicrobia bacterium]|nr:hypothetical protein [Verrucomicrobiota bacterium]
MSAPNTIHFTLEFSDNGTAAKVGQAMNGMLNGLQNGAAQLNNGLGPAVAKAANGFGALNGAANLFSSTVMGGFGIAGLLSMVQSAAGAAREYQHLAEIMDTSVGQASGLAQAARQAGAGMNTLEAAAVNAAMAVRAAKDDNSQAARVFQMMGADAAALKTPMDVFLAVANFIRNDTRPEIEKLALAKQILGRNIRELLPLLREGGAALSALGDYTDADAKAAKEFTRQFEEIRDVLTRDLGVPVLKALNTSWGQFVVVIGAAAKAGQMLAAAMDLIAVNAPAAGRFLGSAAGTLSVGGLAAYSLVTGTDWGKKSAALTEAHVEMDAAESAVGIVKILSMAGLKTAADLDGAYRNYVVARAKYEAVKQQLTGTPAAAATAKTAAVPAGPSAAPAGMVLTPEEQTKLQQMSLARTEAGLKNEDAALKDHYARRKITFAAYIAQRQTLAIQEFEPKISAARDSAARLQTAYSKLTDTDEMKPRKLLELAAAQTEVVKLEQSRNAALAAIDRDARDGRIELAKQSSDREVQLAEASGQKLTAAKLKIEQDYQEKLRAAPAGDKAYRDNLRLTRDLQMVHAEDADTLDKLTQADKNYNTSVQETANLLQAGSINQSQARARNAQAAKNYLPVAVNTASELRGARQDILAVNPDADVSELDAQLKQIDATILKIRQDARELSIFGEMEDGMRKFGQTMSDVGAQATQALQGVINHGIDGVTNGIMGMITGAMSWGEAMRQAALAIISDLVRISLQIAVGFAIQAILGSAAAAAAAALAAPVAAAWAPAAVSASIATMGAADAIGTGAYIGALATAKGSALAAAVAGGLADGGIVRGPGGPRDDMAGLFALSNGEAVLPAGVVAQNPSFIQNMIDGAVNLRDMAAGIPGAIAAPIGEAAGYGAGGSFGGSINVSPAAVHVAVLNTTQQVRSFLESTDGRKVLYDITRSQLLDLGITA